MEELLQKYKIMQTKLQAYNYFSYITNWDSDTEAPNGCFPDRTRYLGVLNEERYKLQTSREFMEIVDRLYECKDLENKLAYEIRQIKKRNEKMKMIPQNEYVEFQKLMATSQSVWAKAKRTNDYELFKPILKAVVEYNQRICKYWETDKLKGYDVLLDDYEEGMTSKEYDVFFDLLKKKIVPFVHKISKIKLNNNSSFSKLSYPIEKQKEFCDYLIDVLCFDRNRGLMKESEHPFTSGFGTEDVRITVHYYEKNFTSSIFSVIHELGHAIYEQQGDKALNDTFISGGSSMAMHESQSRFFENIIGRNYAFWQCHYSKLQSIFCEQLKDVSLNEFYMFINKVGCSLIRTEADELTYPLHIMLRYDLEKALIDGDVTVDNLPEKWNQLMKEYLGVDVPNDTMGVLQDVHWSDGLFGYFPTYALGSAFASQILTAMEREIDVFDDLANTKRINEWLKDRIHHFSASMDTKDILKSATDEQFNPEYYVRYLVKKYQKIYGLGDVV